MALLCPVVKQGAAYTRPIGYSEESQKDVHEIRYKVKIFLDLFFEADVEHKTEYKFARSTASLSGKESRESSNIYPPNYMQ